MGRETQQRQASQVRDDGGAIPRVADACFFQDDDDKDTGRKEDERSDYVNPAPCSIWETLPDEHEHGGICRG
jgi:hypothetical protein